MLIVILATAAGVASDAVKCLITSACVGGFQGPHLVEGGLEARGLVHMAFFLRLSNNQFSASEPGGAHQDQTTPWHLRLKLTPVTKILKILTTDEIEPRIFLFDSHEHGRFQTCHDGCHFFKPNYQRPFFTCTENLFFSKESLCRYGSLFRSGVPWR